MAESKTANELMFEKLAEGLDSTSQLTHALLTEIRESEADFAAIKTELAILRENVKSLSNIVREGNGATSLLTKIALIEQRIDSIDKWMDNHADSHRSLKLEIGTIKEEIDDLQKSTDAVEKSVEQIWSKIEESEKEQRDSIHREVELAHVHKKSAAVLKEERQKALTKILAAIVIAAITFVATWYAKDMISPEEKPRHDQRPSYEMKTEPNREHKQPHNKKTESPKQPHPSPSSSSAQP
jgi:chromosome segregation ATPase